LSDFGAARWFFNNRLLGSGATGVCVQKFLAFYLAVTGVLAFVALAAPSVVVFGFFLLILPGLILSLAPTAFLWGCVFAASWFAARAFLPNSWATVAVAAVVTLVALAAVTEFNRAGSRLAQAATVRPDITPPARLAIKGDVRIDLPRPRWDNKNPSIGQRGFSCDNLCVALLFTPGVTSVTINNSSEFSLLQHRDGTGPFDPEARTYRLLPKGQCPGGGLQPDLEGRDGLYPGVPDAGLALAAEWNLKFASEVCLTRSAAIDRHDILVRRGRYGGLRPMRSWSLAPSLPDVEYLEIRNGSDDVLFRRLKSSVRVLARILSIEMSGGIENFGFGWATTEFSNKPKYWSLDLLKELEGYTDIVGRASGADLIPALRGQLRAALANPALTGDDAAFKVIPAYINGLANPLPAEDLEIMTRLARDNRVSRYENIWKLAKLPVEQQRQIRAAFVSRALATSEPQLLLRSLANSFIDQMPNASMTAADPDEDRLLADPNKRWALPSLAGRLYERGPSTVPLLVTLIREHSLVLNANIAAARDGRAKAYETSRLNEGQQQVVAAARASLCRLGPAASAAIAPLDQMLADGTISKHAQNGFRGEDWNFTLARLGKPVDQLRKPESLSGTDESHRRRIRSKLNNFRPDRSC